NQVFFITSCFPYPFCIRSRRTPSGIPSFHIAPADCAEAGFAAISAAPARGRSHIRSTRPKRPASRPNPVGTRLAKSFAKAIGVVAHGSVGVNTKLLSYNPETEGAEGDLLLFGVPTYRGPKPSSEEFEELELASAFVD